MYLLTNNIAIVTRQIKIYILIRKSKLWFCFVKIKREKINLSMSTIFDEPNLEDKVIYLTIYNKI